MQRTPLRQRHLGRAMNRSRSCRSGTPADDPELKRVSISLRTSECPLVISLPPGLVLAFIQCTARGGPRRFISAPEWEKSHPYARATTDATTWLHCDRSGSGRIVATACRRCPEIPSRSRPGTTDRGHSGQRKGVIGSSSAFLCGCSAAISRLMSAHDSYSAPQ